MSDSNKREVGGRWAEWFAPADNEQTGTVIKKMNQLGLRSGEFQIVARYLWDSTSRCLRTRYTLIYWVPDDPAPETADSEPSNASGD